MRSFSDSSYTIYLLHLPVFVLLYKALFQYIHLGALPEYALLITITYVTCYVIKPSKLLSLAFNGKLFSLKDYSPLGRKLNHGG